MDIRCPKCAEPIDNDELHYIADDMSTTYRELASAFRTDGCAAIGYRCNPDTVGNDAAAAASVLYEILGDDMDGAAAMLDDFGF